MFWMQQAKKEVSYTTVQTYEVHPQNGIAVDCVDCVDAW